MSGIAAGIGLALLVVLLYRFVGCLEDDSTTTRDFHKKVNGYEDKGL